MAAVRRGALIVFEGCDRSGKTTQSRLLAEHLQHRKIPVKLLGFPARSSHIGKVLDAYLKNKTELSDEAIHLMFSANRWEYMHKLREYLTAGTTLIVDRYTYSGIAYSVAKGLSFEWCTQSDKGLIQPDIVFYLKAPSDSLAERGKYGEERYEKLAFQQQVAAVYERIGGLESSYWHAIDARQSIEDLSKALIAKTADVLAQAEQQPLKLII